MKIILELNYPAAATTITMPTLSLLSHPARIKTVRTTAYRFLRLHPPYWTMVISAAQHPTAPIFASISVDTPIRTTGTWSAIMIIIINIINTHPRRG
jgi:hypothetical protein